MSKIRYRKKKNTSAKVLVGVMALFVLLYVCIITFLLYNMEYKELIKKNRSYTESADGIINGRMLTVKSEVASYCDELFTDDKNKINNVLDTIKSKYDFNKALVAKGNNFLTVISNDSISPNMKDCIRYVYDSLNKENEKAFFFRQDGCDFCEIVYAIPIEKNKDKIILVVTEKAGEAFGNNRTSFLDENKESFCVNRQGELLTLDGNINSRSIENNLYSFLSEVDFSSGNYEKVFNGMQHGNDGYAVYSYEGKKYVVTYVCSDSDLGYYSIMISYFSDIMIDTNQVLLMSIGLCSAFVVIILIFFATIRRKDKDINNRISDLAYKDRDFGINNINYLCEHMYELVSETNIQYTYVSLDIDNFKNVNSILGYDNGTKVLEITANELRREFSENNKEYVFHENGDMFGVLVLRQTKLEMKERFESLFARIRQKVYASFSSSTYIVFATGLCNVEFGEGNKDTTPRSIIDAADFARKEVKGSYDRHFEFFGAELERRITEKNVIEKEMKKALENEEFVVYLQPKMNMVTANLCGAEALVRWQHEKNGLMMPGKFIPIFERNGFIIQLDLYMFEKICQLKKRWRNEGRDSVVISVNMSRLHLISNDFVSNLVSIARRYNVNTSEIELELTENVFLEDSKKFLEITEQIKSEGFLLSVDDFGSGYSSLNILKDIPVDVIKLDREFLNKCESSEKSKKIIKNIIAMIKDLKLEIVTEGVETAEQVELLTNYGCEIAQGFYYARPMPVPDYERFAQIHKAVSEREFVFNFKNNLLDETGKYKGRCVGETSRYVDGIMQGEYAILIPGGDKDTNYIEFPKEILSEGSYSISLWLKAGEYLDWQSIIYAEYQNGFMSIMPSSFGGVMGYRIKDDDNPDAWYDAFYSTLLRTGKWYNIVVTYNAKTEVSRLYMNGKAVGYRDNVTTLHGVKCIYLGGDIYAPTENAIIARLKITNVVKSASEIKKGYDEVLQEIEEKALNTSTLDVIQC